MIHQHRSKSLPIDEALSHCSLGEARNHERWESLGDAVLRLAAT